MHHLYDCVVVGSGHAGSCAALSAVEGGCKKALIIDKCPPEWVGGNGYFTAGAHRTAHQGLTDLWPIVRNVTQEMVGRIDMEAYSDEAFVSDIMRLGEGKPNLGLVTEMVAGSRSAVDWLAKVVRVPFIFTFHRQAYEVEGRQKFWGGMVLGVEDGGKGLISAHQRALTEAGVEIWFQTTLVDLDVRENLVEGLVVEKDGTRIQIRTPAVVLAAGGFEANAAMRVQHLGQEWGRAMVRGTPYNTGDCFSIAQRAGARLVGDWKGCHSTAWDANASPNSGHRELTNQFTKSGYPLGIMVNCQGKRFVDEGEDFRNYTYAKFGRAILQQPHGFAFQVWDTKVLSRLRVEEYGDDVVEKILANDLEELADKLVEHGLQNKQNFLQSLHEFNEAVRYHRMEHAHLRWDPAVKDGLSTQSEGSQLDLPKSNWALSIDEAPFVAVKVGCGITFTFGGLAIDPKTSGVISEVTGTAIRGLFCAGEMVGDLFYNNYPGGSGLTAGAVFGRKAGQVAAQIS
ncbi:FAD/NAD(P)-binding domain-containing protein [Pluteus cervinus]|uniref:FAD/NAD(P)-binding domain-containing protein n=1 Tax=Pluteus cervinus TaxID=181527 RepID=A0ACD3B6I3_9AGAR|nr:FAD/NAD(P)-binding domain-containing protein [Pluteus cervinus]